MQSNMAFEDYLLTEFFRHKKVLENNNQGLLLSLS